MPFLASSLSRPPFSPKLTLHRQITGPWKREPSGYLGELERKFLPFSELLPGLACKPLSTLPQLIVPVSSTAF